MTGLDLYDEFKEALDYLGAGFHGMKKVKISMINIGILIENDKKSCVIKIPLGEIK